MCGRKKTDVHCDVCGVNQKKDKTVIERACGCVLCDTCYEIDMCGNSWDNWESEEDEDFWTNIDDDDFFDNEDEGEI